MEGSKVVSLPQEEYNYRAGVNEYYKIDVAVDVEDSSLCWTRLLWKKMQKRKRSQYDEVLLVKSRQRRKSMKGTYRTRQSYHLLFCHSLDAPSPPEHCPLNPNKFIHHRDG